MPGISSVKEKYLLLTGSFRGLKEMVMYNVHLSLPGAAELNKQQFLTLWDSQGQLILLTGKVV